MANCQTFKIFVLLKRVRGEDLVLFKIQGTGQRSSESTPGFELGWRDIYYSLLLVVAIAQKIEVQLITILSMFFSFLSFCLCYT